jgi:hypothetical protein
MLLGRVSAKRRPPRALCVRGRRGRREEGVSVEGMNYAFFSRGFGKNFDELVIYETYHDNVDIRPASFICAWS